MSFPPEPMVECVPIIKQERDDLRRFNAEMRVLLKDVRDYDILPMDGKVMAEYRYRAAKLIVEQEIAGFK